MTNLTVTDRPDDHRFEVRDDQGDLLGVAAYERRPGLVVFTHTEVEPEHEGQGVGGTLVREALDAVRAAGDRIDPQCAFVRSFVEEHPDYADLVADPAR
jgi:predicted GNAT family acetyltransferase